MKIQKSGIPEHSLIKDSSFRIDYQDCFCLDLEKYNAELTVDDIVKRFFNSSPSWINSLFLIRNKIASLLGLKIPDDQKDRKRALENFTCQPGEKLGLFQVLERNESEIVMGEDDKHLNFRVSLLLKSHAWDQSQYLFVSTLVQFNNIWGRVYFLPVKPFHNLIVPAMMRSAIKNKQVSE